ncbi:MAG TPA: RNA polymerase sigma-70 factor [Thermoleophilaceae bacterium]|nr:RNA polymerase sigma-70 factor [Thermoleophilaceae bacterium]
MATAEDDEIDALRRRGFAIAYRMLGSVGDAEDVVQEALLRLHRARAAGERIESPQAYVSTVVTRLAIDQLRSARARREQYVGEWLPEPLVTATDDLPPERAELADSLSFAFLVLLESLTPEQRAALLLRDVFDYPYDEVAAIVGKSEDNARQLATRARKAVEARRPRFDASRERRDALADRFFAAAAEGDLAGLEALLADDVALHGDGGGKVPALARALSGANRVARTLVNWAKAGRRFGGPFVRRVDLNGQPGALLLDADGRLFGAMTLEIADGRVQAIHSVVNPDKLAHLGQVADMQALLRGE